MRLPALPICKQNSSTLKPPLFACSNWPQDAPAWFNLGYAVQQTGRHEDAESAFRGALALDPLMGGAWYGLGLALMQRQQFHEAAKR